MPHPRRTLLVLAAALTATACSSGDSESDTLLEPLVVTQPETVVLLQNRVPDVVMEALWTGPVIRDEGGCLRIGDAQGASVVWPVGFTAEGDRILSDTGALVGTVGQSLRMGGGIVGTLHDGLPMSEAEKERARTLCPGNYWIVGELPDL